MKRLKSLFLVGVLACLMLGVTNVNAMTKDELEAKLTKTYEINGVNVSADSSAKVEIEKKIEQKIQIPTGICIFFVLMSIWGLNGW